VIGAALAWLIGSAAVLSVGALAPGGAVAGLLAACLVVAASSRRPWPLAFALGLALTWFAAGRGLDRRLDPALEGRDLSIQGVVVSVPQQRGEAVRFRLEVRSPALPARIELSWLRPAFVPLAAERLDLVVRLRRPRGYANPGGTDQEARLLREGIGATGYVRSAVRGGRSAGELLAHPVLAARGTIDGRIRAALGERPATGIVSGLAVGLQDALDPGQWRTLARSGTSHLMAISGLHIGMFAVFAGGLAARIQRRRQRRGALAASRDVAVLTGTLAAFAYSLLAGWSVPTQRTMVMIALAAAALRLRRRASPGGGLAFCAIVVLALEPLAPLAPGFWLSFGAVAAILFGTSGTVGHLSALEAYLKTQLAVTLGLVPVLAGAFGGVSLVSIAVNALAIPLYTLVIVPAILISTALALLVPAVGQAALRVVAWSIEATWPLLAVPASVPHALWGVATLPGWAWAVLACGAVATVLPLPAPGRVAGAVLVASLCAWRAPPPPVGGVHLAVLDVGQGLAVVVETRRHLLVYDTGPAFRSGGDTGAVVVEPYLRSRGLRRIDVLVASHDDDDHAGGAASLARLVPVDGLVASGRVLDALGHVEACRAGGRWTWDGVQFEWLHPADPLLPRDNDRSCVLEIRAGEHAVLLTGDIQRDAERELIARNVLQPLEVVVVPHHGSRTSSGSGLVARTRPRWAIVSAGYRNRWGFPAAEVAQRWSDGGADLRVTAGSGAIEFDLLAGQPVDAPVESRRTRRRAWRDP
jgi:competence protein ComEC